MMLPVDLNELEEDIRETFEEVGDHSAMALFHLTPTDGGLNYETKKKTYTRIAEATGRIRLSPTVEELTAIGMKKDCTALFTFSTQHLKDIGIISIGEEGRLLCAVELNDLIKYKGSLYRVENIAPNAMIGDRFLLYKFECIEVSSKGVILEVANGE